MCLSYWVNNSPISYHGVVWSNRGFNKFTRLLLIETVCHERKNWLMKSEEALPSPYVPVLLLYFKLIDRTFGRICSNGQKLQKHLIC